MISTSKMNEGSDYEFEWCKTCREYDQDKHCCPRYNKVIRNAVEEIKQSKMGHWIPISERLPEEETDVLVCNDNEDIEISRGSYSTEIKNEFIWYTSGWRFGEVIAWMPLPEPYEPQAESEGV